MSTIDDLPPLRDVIASHNLSARKSLGADHESARHGNSIDLKAGGGGTTYRMDATRLTF